MLAMLGVLFALSASSAVPDEGFMSRGARSPFSAAETDELECRNCILRKTYFNEILIHIEHKLPDQCSGGMASAPRKGAAWIFSTASYKFSHRAEEEEAGNCGRCGGTSICHYYYEEGPCHVGCGGGGEELLVELTLSSLASEDLPRLLERSESGPLLEFNATRNAFQVIGCDGSVTAHIPSDQVRAGHQLIEFLHRSGGAKSIAAMRSGI